MGGNEQSSLLSILEGEVFERRENAARQVIVEGNATDGIGSDKLLLISAGTSPQSIADLRIEPPILTPNGDGRNDYTQISFTLFGVLDARIDITFYNLSDEPVRQLKAMHQKAALNAALAWDHRDASGEPVSPGLYLCTVKTAATLSLADPLPCPTEKYLQSPRQLLQAFTAPAIKPVVRRFLTSRNSKAVGTVATTAVAIK